MQERKRSGGEDAAGDGAGAAARRDAAGDGAGAAALHLSRRRRPHQVHQHLRDLLVLRLLVDRLHCHAYRLDRWIHRRIWLCLFGAEVWLGLFGQDGGAGVRGHVREAPAAEPV